MATDIIARALAASGGGGGEPVDAYTKAETNDLLATKADKDTSYTKTEVDNLLTEKEDNILSFDTWADYEKVKNTIPADTYFVVKEDEQENPIPSHNSLMNRDANECHPINAITGLQAELDKKTDATDTDVLKARVDQLVGTVPPGSADEIADARVMADGKTSQNLGDAIRTQVSGLKETIAEIKDNIIEYKSAALATEQHIVTDEIGEDIEVVVPVIKTDSSLKDELLPANAKAVGDAITDERNLRKTEINNVIEKIGSYDVDVDVIKQIIDDITEVREVAISDESGDEIVTDADDPLTSLIKCVLTDASLTHEYLPANAKAVGDRIENKTKFIFETFLQNNNYYSVKWGMPILKLYGSMEGMTKDNKKSFDFLYRDAETIIEGTCKLKWQGSSSAVYPKKNFTMTFDDPANVVSAWGSHKKYVLKANYIDPSHSRNIVCAKLWGQIVHSRAKERNELTTDDGYLLSTGPDTLGFNANKLMDLVNGGAVDGFPIIIVHNDEFYGLYTFNIPKDAWMFGMDELRETCGIITSEYHEGNPNLFKAQAKIDGTDYSVEYYSGDDDTAFKNSFNNLIQHCIDCHTQDDYDELNNYIDIESAIDYMIFLMLISGNDYIKNVMYGSYDGNKFFVSAYDMDTTFGNHWTGTRYFPIDCLPTTSDITNHRLFYLIMKYDKEKVIERYRYLRSKIMSEENILYTFTNFMESIQLAVKNEDVKKWPLMPGTVSNDLAQILNNYRLRTKLIDNQIDQLA